MTTTMMKVAAILPDPNQHRQQRNPEDQRRLNESVNKIGILQSLGVRKNGMLVWGMGRLLAAIAAGLEEVPVVILDTPMTEGEYMTFSVIENMLRFDLSPHDKWRACVRLKEVNPGWQNQDLAKALSLDPSSVTRLLSPSRCTAEWQEALKEGKVGIGDCYAAAGKPEAEQAALLALKLSGARRDDIVQAARKRRNSENTPSVKLSKVTICLKETTVVLTGTALDVSRVVEILSETLKEARKAEDQYDIKTWERMMRDKAKAG